MGKVSSESPPQLFVSRREKGPSHLNHLTDPIFCRLKLSREQIDDRVVEVHWDSAVSHWRMMRFRDDKPNGNHRTVVENIIQSIVDGVEKEAVGLSPRAQYIHIFSFIRL